MMTLDIDTPNILTIVVLGFTAWNSYQHSRLKLAMAEVILNLKREFNGRYQPRDTTEIMNKAIEQGVKAVEARVTRLETAADLNKYNEHVE